MSTVKFHSMSAIAALLSILVRNAEDESGDFGSFEAQIGKTRNLAAAVRANRSTTGAARFEKISEHVQTFYDASDDNKVLFKKAHEAIRDLLVALPADEWGPCNFVSHAQLRKLIEMDEVG